MSRVHSPSMYPARFGGPPYCKACDSDWPCAGSQMENADARRESRALEEVRAEAVTAERARLAEAVRGLPSGCHSHSGLRCNLDWTDGNCSLIDGLDVLALLDPDPR